MRLSLIFISIALSILSCKKSPKSTISDIDASEYIVSHSNKFIKPTENPYIRFRSMSIDESKINQEVDRNAISISPQVKGAFVWVDNETVEFKPQEKLDYDKRYSISIDIDKIFEVVDLNNPIYVFDINTDQLYFSVDPEKLEYASSDQLFQYLNIQTNTELTTENINKLFSVSQNGVEVRDVELQYISPQTYKVKAGPIIKKDKSTELKIAWNIKDQNAKLSSQIIKKIPSNNEFSLVDIRMASEDNLHLQVSFSDPLAKQDFKGLVTVEGYSGTYKFKSVGNILHVYLNEKIYGNHNVVISRKIKNTSGISLEETERNELLFLHSFPELRSLAKGNIVPHTDKVIFPFEAISIDTIEIQIFQLFQNNVLEALRYNSIGDANTNQYLGRVVHSEKIPLRNISSESNKDKWVRYAIDIKDLTSIESGAIYQIRIGYKKSYVNYSCDIESKHPDTRSSAFDFENFYRNYNYNNRSNPCFKEYYDKSKFLYRNILASNLGMIVKKGKSNTLHVVTTDIRDASVVDNVLVKVYDMQGQLLVDGRSDKNGVINCQADRKPYFVIAQSNDDYAYLNLQDNKVNPLSEFDVSGVDVKDGLQGYLYGERGVWRPGDTLHLSFMLIDNKNAIDNSHPVELTVRDSKGNTKYNQVSIDGEDGIFVFHVPTSYNDPTGLWKADVEAGNFKYSQRLKVETIKPNRLKVDLEFNDEEIDVTEKESFTLRSEWLHGAQASGLKAEVDVKYIDRKTNFNGYSDYDFVDPSRQLSSDLISIFSGNLNDQGEEKVNINFGKKFQPPGRLTGQFRTRVYEKSGNYSEDFTSIDINPYKVYAGVMIPKSRWGGKVLNVEEDEPIKFVSIDKDGKVAANRKVSVGVYKANWNWWYNRSDNNLYRFNSTSHLGAIDKQELVTDASGQVSFVPQLEGHDSYLVRVCDDESGHCSGTLFYTSRYNYAQKKEGEIAKLDFETDKNKYSIGENIELSIPSNGESKIYISIESNEKVLDGFWVAGKDGATKLSIPVSNDMQPNVYIHATMLQGVNKNNDLPIRLYGVNSVSVTDPSTVLGPVIGIDDVIRPNKMTSVTISESNGKEMAYTLALVDEGLLDITNFKTPDPWSVFFAKQSLGVKTWDIFDDVLNRHGGAIESIISIGGDAAALEANQNAQSNRFKPVIRFMGPYKVKAGEKKTHQVDIPNYVGSLRVMLVAKSGNSFGKKEKNVTVKDPLMLMTTLPRVLAPNESLSLPVNVFAYDDKIKNAKIDVDVSPNLKVVGDNSGSLSFTKQGDKLYNFDVKVLNSTGAAEVKVNSTSSTFKAYEDIEIAIRNPSPKKSEVYSQLIKEGKSHSFDFSAIGIEGSNEAYVELSHFPEFNFSGRLDYLMRYPYGCVEQTTSSVFPQLYLDVIKDLTDEERADIKRNITAGIKRLQSFQKRDGGLSYWSGSYRLSDWGTSYAGHFIIQAKQKGYFVPNSFFNSWKKYQKKACRSYKYQKNDYYQVQQAYRLYTLALAGDPQLSEMNNLRTEKYLDKLTRYLLSATYAIVNQKTIAEELISGLDFNIKSYRSMAYTYGSDLRDRSIILLSLIHQGDESNSYKLALEIADALAKENWYSTQTTAFALLSLSEFLAGQEKDILKYDLTHNRDLKISQSSENVMDVYQLDLSTDPQQKLSVVNNSKAPMYVRVVNSGKPLPTPQPSYAKGIDVKVKYIDEEGEILDPKNLELGTDFKVQVTVKNTSNIGLDYKELALNHTLPSGWEIQNLRVGDISSGSNSAFEFQDIKDDRVYTFFDLDAGKSKTFTISLTAAYAGEFFMPNIKCGAMYDEDIEASVTGAWVKVIR